MQTVGTISRTKPVFEPEIHELLGVCRGFFGGPKKLFESYTANLLRRRVESTPKEIGNKKIPKLKKGKNNNFN